MQIENKIWNPPRQRLNKATILHYSIRPMQPDKVSDYYLYYMCNIQNYQEFMKKYPRW